LQSSKKITCEAGERQTPLPTASGSGMTVLDDEIDPLVPPRWTAYDAKRFGVKMSPEVPMTTTERAYTSPIWYTPGT
jgi:hypothetical protein